MKNLEEAVAEARHALERDKRINGFWTEDSRFVEVSYSTLKALVEAAREGTYHYRATGPLGISAPGSEEHARKLVASTTFPEFTTVERRQEYIGEWEAVS